MGKKKQKKKKNDSDRNGRRSEEPLCVLPQLAEVLPAGACVHHLAVFEVAR